MGVFASWSWPVPLKDFEKPFGLRAMRTALADSPALFMSASAAIADPLLLRVTGE